MKVNLKKVVEYYYTCTELTTKQLAEMTGFSKQTIAKYKPQIQLVMKEKGISCFQQKNVETETALEFFGINIKKAEKGLQMLEKCRIAE